MTEIYTNASSTTHIIISIALMLFIGFLMTRITKKIKLPNVTAYIITGILLGPYCLKLVPEKIISGMDFLSDIALAFIAFSTGEFFKFDVLKKNGIKVIIITIFESIGASLFVFILSYFVLKLQLSFSVVLSALAAATAPASTIMTIRQTGAKGDFVDTLLQVVALDDIVGLVLYSVAISIAVASQSGEAFNIRNILVPIMSNLGILILGGVFGFILKLFIIQKRSTDNRLIITIALLFAFCGICEVLGVSALLGCMAMGTIYINITNDTKLFKQINYFSPPILLLFFVRSGLNFKLDALLNSSNLIGNTPLLVIGVLYFLVRIIGKYLGAFWGCSLVHKNKEVRNYLGLALIPQAGVAIGLAALGARTLGGEVGIALETIILASSVLYELVGPACAKLSLYLSHSYSDKLEDIAPVTESNENGEIKKPVEILIERIQKIQNELPNKKTIEIENEEAFTEAAEKQYEELISKMRGNK